MSTLPAREGYRLWAPSYEAETVVSFLERRAVEALGVPTARRRLLDVGCGTGRRLHDADAATVVGVDVTPEMLAIAPAQLALAAGDVRALPLADASFDVVWCRLVVGHLRELDAAYAELARVCVPGGTVVVTDLAAEAAAAGHRRTFRDASGTVQELEHHVHAAHAHVEAASHAGLALAAHRRAVVDASVEPLYAAAGRLDRFAEQRGLPLVLALAFRRHAR
ncbi:Methyltransferase type 11 [Gemmatirosa kalamazoonensis]|uniref:Methyltransferase type 11 n=1 Tax=Gemmatirosa kalamazoonensis TaxID=861299 RepID=W0RC67_9BACT|nr:class I SAM-dependent methyltransferase [Gemmatirosa kalamazoonensis]AHG88381.1 Methyltransferase type 11 [Gemmatirosa kalamazoonensis]